MDNFQEFYRQLKVSPLTYTLVHCITWTGTYMCVIVKEEISDSLYPCNLKRVLISRYDKSKSNEELRTNGPF